jgi:hypothetical protein
MSHEYPDPPGAGLAVGRADQDSPPPLAPGRYLQLRRKAAQLELSDLALLIASDIRMAEPSSRRRPIRPADRSLVQRRLFALENGTDGPGVELDLIRAIARHVAFDEQVYLALVGVNAAPDAGLPVPNHCRSCGCSWQDPCLSPGPCAWTDAAGTVCTACDPRPPHALPTGARANQGAPGAGLAGGRAQPETFHA